MAPDKTTHSRVRQADGFPLGVRLAQATEALQPRRIQSSRHSKRRPREGLTIRFYLLIPIASRAAAEQHRPACPVELWAELRSERGTTRWSLGRSRRHQAPSRHLRRLRGARPPCYVTAAMPARDHDLAHVRRALTNDPCACAGASATSTSTSARSGCSRRRRARRRSPSRSRASRGPPSTTTSRRPDRVLYLAVSERAYQDAFEDPLGQLLLAKGRAKLMIYSDEKETIRQWTPEPPTAK
jgi:XisH protein